MLKYDLQEEEEEEEEEEEVGLNSIESHYLLVGY